MIQVQPERPRAHRYSFVASIELTDVQSETQTREQTSDLSLFGCHVDTREPLPTGTVVRIRIAHKGAKFAAFGRVAYARPNAGMGVVFTRIEGNNQSVLEKWIAEIRDKRGPRAQGQ
jgi:PilZ domain